MESEERAVCPENDALVDYMRNWWLELSHNNPKSYTQNTQRNIQRAFTNLCHSQTHVKTLKDFKSIKGVGNWFVKQMQGFFNTDSGASEGDDLPKEGTGKDTSTRHYVPQKNSVAYALLITLYRAHEKGIEFMRKQELIDAAEASGLSRVPIAPEKGKGKPGQPGSSKNEWYSGWTVMGKLVDKCLVAKISCPAKYKLTVEGRQVAYECLLRSNMLDSISNSSSGEKYSEPNRLGMDSSELVSSDVAKKVPLTDVDMNIMTGSQEDVSIDCLEMESQSCGSTDKSTSYTYVDGQHLHEGVNYTSFRSCTSFETCSVPLTSCSSSDNFARQTSQSGFNVNKNDLSKPPLGMLEKFEDTYKVILVLDDREHFVRSKSRNLIENICSQYKIEIQIRRLPVGDGIWVARHKHCHTEYVLDFIVERKNVDDLRSSIRDNRYRDQKLRLLRTGLKKIIYMVEGDPNVCEAADCIKTACFTTEILEGFDVQRTMGLADTLKRYGYLTLAITDFYTSASSNDSHRSVDVCPSYNEFMRKCDNLDKMTVTDVFATQLMQVPQVTEEVAIAVVSFYPTLYSLACAYSLLDGDVRAQEELLRKKSDAISATASRNIFRFVWQS